MTKTLAVATALLCSFTTIVFYLDTETNDLSQLRGTAASCTNCIDDVFPFNECVHFQPGDPNGTNCRQDGCIENFYFDARCEESVEVNDCGFATEPDVIWRRQIVHAELNITEDCNDPGVFVPVPGSPIPHEDCNPMYPVDGNILQGKCFIDVCDGGTIWADTADPPIHPDFLGRTVCAGP